MRTEQQRQREREQEAWVRQTTLARLRQVHPGNHYPELLEHAQTGHTWAAIYALVGSKAQVAGSGLIRQVEQCLKVCILRGFAVTEEDIFLEVGSGSDAERPVLERLLSHCQSGRYQVIVIEASDRWWQGTASVAEPLFARLEAAGTRLVTAWGLPPMSQRATAHYRQAEEAALAGAAIERLLGYGAQSGKPLETLGRLWVAEGEEAVVRLVSEWRE